MFDQLRKPSNHDDRTWDSSGWTPVFVGARLSKTLWSMGKRRRNSVHLPPSAVRRLMTPSSARFA